MFERMKERWRFLRGERAFRLHPVRVALRLIVWRIRCWLGLGATIRIEPEVLMRLPSEWRGIAKMVFIFREEYEAELAWARRNLRSGMVCIDGGAALGIWTLTMAKAVGPRGLVVAFEPSADLFELLRENVKLNTLENVVLIKKALGDRSGNISLYRTANTHGAFSLAEPEGVRSELETVEVTTLPDALSALGLSRLDFMKLDLEGAEGLALRAANFLLKGDDPPIVMYEQHSESQAQLSDDSREAWHVLKEAGYSQHKMNSLTLELIPLERPVRGGNVMALPEGRRAGEA